MPRTRMKVSLPRFTFLSCAISVHQGVRVGRSAGIVADVGRQPDRRKVMRHASGLVGRHQAEPGGELERADDAERDRLAMQEFVGKAGRCLERMPEGVAEIEQRAVAGLALVARHDRGLAAARDRDRVLARRTAGEHVLPVRLQPGEEAGIAEQAELRDLRIAGAEVARGKRVEQRGIGDHQDRLMERADQVLAVARIDPGLAADRGIDLRQQRGRHLHDVEAAAQDRGGKAREIADHAAAERDHHVVALDARIEQPVADVLAACASSSKPRRAAR